MKKVLLVLMLALGLTGCSTVKGIFGHNATKEQKSAAKIEMVQDSIAQNTSDKLDAISGFSFGVDYSLSKATNSEPAVEVAKTLNQRVESIAGLPALEQQKEIWTLVSDLISTNQSLVKQGNDLLLAKDKDIITLQVQKKDLEENKDKAISDYMQLANATAMKSDTLSSQLSSYQSYWGLGGVFKGLFSFGKHIVWGLVILGTVYTVLRVLADVYPPMGIAWGVFSQIGAVLITMVEKIFPQALSKLQVVESSIHDEVVSELAQLKAAIVSSTTPKP